MKKNKNKTFWVVEKSDGKMYLYSESGDHHLAAEESRNLENLKRLNIDLLDDECNLSDFMPDNSYYLIENCACEPEPKSRKKLSNKKKKKKNNKKLKD